ncbi:uncharacterized protein AB675_7044 [Cyphellophora attinorum]|uniref:Uncharacterized protein n=1 Tax=Cyphellophora attinorum TaxID=1664694 RepID=A0A0N1H8L6_9EURO|nr:uncharacterized protein AB675_7044 [Phialophora attinorum]KPI43422.1 hypothetical protein AB675_7044 [Phialophora attinorum]
MPLLTLPNELLTIIAKALADVGTSDDVTLLRLLPVHRQVVFSAARIHVKTLLIETELPLRTYNQTQYYSSLNNFPIRSPIAAENTTTRTAYGRALKPRIDVTNLNQAQRRAFWDVYREKLNEQEAFTHHWPGNNSKGYKSTEIFQALPSLQTIKFTGGNSSRFMLREGDTLSPDSLHYRTLTVPPPLSVDVGPQNQNAAYFARETQAQKVPGKWLCSILDGLLQSGNESVQHLSIGGLPLQFFRFMQLPTNHPGLPGLKTLWITLMAPRTLAPQQKDIIRTNINFFASHIGPNIEELQWLGVAGENENTGEVFPHIFAPNLNLGVGVGSRLGSLKLDWTETSFAEMTGLLGVHGHGLTKLSLATVKLSDGYWVDIFHNIRYICQNLQTVNMAENMADESGELEEEETGRAWAANPLGQGPLYTELCDWLKHDPAAHPDGPLLAT